jgi:hypothetical protein
VCAPLKGFEREVLARLPLSERSVPVFSVRDAAVPVGVPDEEGFAPVWEPAEWELPPLGDGVPDGGLYDPREPESDELELLCEEEMELAELPPPLPDEV